MATATKTKGLTEVREKRMSRLISGRIVMFCQVRQQTVERLTGDLTPSSPQLCEPRQPETGFQLMLFRFKGLVQRQTA